MKTKERDRTMEAQSAQTKGAGAAQSTPRGLTPAAPQQSAPRSPAARRAGGRPLRWLRALFPLSRVLGLGVLAALLALYAFEPRPVDWLRLKVFDLYQVAKPRTVTERPVTIVDIDEESLAGIGQWPWPRTLLAKLVRQLAAAGAILVAFDIVFPEADRMNPATVAKSLEGLDAETRARLLRAPSNDDIFAETIRAHRVVLGRVGAGEAFGRQTGVTLDRTVALKQSPGAPPVAGVAVRTPGLIRNIAVIESAGTGHGLVSLLPEADGIVRRVPAVFLHDTDLLPGLSVEMMRIASDRRSVVAEMSEGGFRAIRVTRDLTLPTDRNGRVWPYFSRRDGAKYVSARDVLERAVDPALIRDKIVVIGTSAFGLHDIRATPVERVTPGVDIHAQVIENAVTASFLERPNWIPAAELGLLLAGGLLMIVFVPLMGARWSLLLFLGVAGGAMATSWFLFTEKRILLDVGYSVFAILVLYTLLTYVGYASEEASRRRVRQAFAYYLAPAMVERLAEDPRQLRLGGETRLMSILFCDVRGFTGISEAFRGDPEGLTRLINRLLTPLTAVILEHRGTVDKYMGDCIMAFWNAPLDDPDHARNACLAALAMQGTMDGLNRQLGEEAAAEGRSHPPLAIGIGINSGDVVVGNMGSDQRFDYSVLGDDVNLASRLEGQSKGYGIGIVVGEKTAALAPGLTFLELDLILVKGKHEAARIFTVLGDATVAQTDGFARLADAHGRMLAAYRAGSWQEARDAITVCRGLADRLPVGGLYDVYEKRIDEYEVAPPPADWNGVYVATSK